MNAFAPGFVGVRLWTFLLFTAPERALRYRIVAGSVTAALNASG